MVQRGGIATRIEKGSGGQFCFKMAMADGSMYSSGTGNKTRHSIANSEDISDQ
jgi:hypothetical protein